MRQRTSTLAPLLVPLTLPVLLAAWPAGAPVAVVLAPQAPACRDSIAAFRRVIAEFQQRQQNVGLSAGVRVGGTTVYLEATGFAELDARRVAHPQMAFSIASVTKAFTGAALLRLVERGKVDLDSEVQRYVPEFPRHLSGRAVTVRALAHHMGALRHWGPERDSALYARHFDDVSDILTLFKDSAWVTGVEPITRYSYSSYGYNTLALVVQRASGRRFQEFVSAEVLAPLRLRSVAFDRPGLGGADRPARYSWYDLRDFHELTDAPQRVPDWDYSHNLGGGGLISNVEDLLSFGGAMLAPGLLSAESLALIWKRPMLQGVTSPMSFGWFPDSSGRRLAVNGSNAGVQAALTVWREPAVVVAILANSWGRGSRSGEFMNSGPDGLVGRLGAICGAR